MRKLVVLVAILGAATSGCLSPGSPFTCATSDQCVLAGAPGTCEPSHACSFPDEGCLSKRKYGHDAGDGLADTCVVELVDVSVTPKVASTLADTTVRFAGAVAGSVDTGFTWSVVDANGGTITADGVYRAPTSAGVYHVRATSHVNPDRTADATITVATSAAPVVIASAGTVAFAVGQPTQTHLVHATGAGQWWLFYDDSAAPTKVHTQYSSDFATWTAGDDLTLPEPNVGDGRALGVAYRALGGHDVVHLSQPGTDPMTLRYHTRALITPGAIAFGTPESFAAAANLNDGTASVITSGGRVIDATGLQGTPPVPDIGNCGYGDVVTWESTMLDTGLVGFATAWAEHVQWCVQNTVNARQLLADGETVYELYVDGVDGGKPVDILMNVRYPDGTWLPLPIPGTTVRPYDAFPELPAQGMELADWMAAIHGGKVHLVRRLGGTGDVYQHRIFDPLARTWSSGTPIPAQASVPGSGLYLAPYGDGLLLVAIAADVDSRIRYSYWDRSTWSAWRTLIAGPANRTTLGGATPDDGTAPALVWTQPDVGVFKIAGARLP